jgi:transposase
VTKKSCYTFVHLDSSEILQALVGLKGVRVLAYRRDRADVELVIEQTGPVMFCPTCGGSARVKDRPTVSYVDLPVYGGADAAFMA